MWHGLRVAEICYLERSDFVWSKNPKIERAYLKIRRKPKLGWEPKTKGSERDVLIHHEYRDILHKMWQYGEGKSNFFLFTQLKHNRLSHAELSSYTRTLFKRLGFPAKELSLHGGRHTPTLHKDKRRRWKSKHS
ncbi:MAG: tyrosine-type recombinase/integrase [Endomicrobium sp.]|nr:tyrosine-type recombinase/integrase [Endomicrobium sp.]